MFKSSFSIAASGALLLLVLGATLARPDNIDKDAEVLSYKNDPADADGNYAYSFDTSNGIQQQEAGNAQGVVGAFEFVSTDGERYAVSYTADENGFQPTGAHLPTPPPIPDAILRALEYIAAHPQHNDNGGVRRK